MSFKKPSHVFIVDDNEIYSMMLDYYLSRDNIYRFVSFISGEECINNLYLNPEIIILDYELPGGMNGYETLIEIKKENPHIHVIILTGNDDQNLKHKLLQAGADDLILKQAHGETHIIEKLENILTREKAKRVKHRKFNNTLLYLVLTAAIIVLTFFTYR